MVCFENILIIFNFQLNESAQETGNETAQEGGVSAEKVGGGPSSEAGMEGREAKSKDVEPVAAEV